jgi:hypothetical protein
MGTTTNLRLTVTVMLVWAVFVALGYLAGAVDGWSPAAGGAIDSASLILFLPVTIIAAIWVVRRPPRWPSLDRDRLRIVLDVDESLAAVVAVRVAGTQPWRPALLFAVIGLGTLLGLLGLNGSALALVFLPMAFVLVPGFMLGTGISNGLAERSARSGRRHSTAWSVPRSGGQPPSWLVLTDRRLALVQLSSGGRMELVWDITREKLVGASTARTTFRTLDRTIRLYFLDGSSIRLTAPDRGPFLAAVG